LDRTPDIRCLVDAKDGVGEGPCWSARDQRLYWLDIATSRLHWLDPATNAAGAWTMPYSVGVCTPLAGGGLLAATEKGLAIVDTRDGTFRLVKKINLGKGFRANDGKIDPVGRFWWSRMHAPKGDKPGGVYRTDPDGRTHRVLEGNRIPNTFGFSPDGEMLYLTDSIAKVITAYTVTARGELIRPRTFVDNTAGATPDGGAVDAEGFLWNAEWHGWRLVRYAPDGRIDRVVRMPVGQPTSCAFGGPDLATLYVTSARVMLSAAALVEQPLAGGLFAFEPGVKGLPLPEFKGRGFAPPA
jgi:sugar lactone lactonase YvrE